MSDFVPVLTGDTANEQRDRLWSCFEVRVSTEVLAVLDGPEEENACERVAQHEQEHAQDDEEGLPHRHHHRQHQHFQSRLANRIQFT